MRFKNLTMKQAIKVKCYDCAFDPADGGKNNIATCADRQCALWAFRPYQSKQDANLVWNEIDFPPVNDRCGEWSEQDLTDEQKAVLSRMRAGGAQAAKNLNG